MIMINILTFLAAVATVTTLPVYIHSTNECMKAENVTVCEIDFRLCSDAFAGNEEEETDEEIHRVCINERSLFSDDESSGGNIFNNDTRIADLPFIGTEDMSQAVKLCIQYKRDGMRPDGTVDPQPLLERLTLALNDTRPDIVQRLHNGTQSCSTENLDSWKSCLLSRCILGNATLVLPSDTISSEE
ncbi:uncharacterized protein LOC119584865 [Penaeus monodon]|uniref:uncharacterized protein LOC119584865 n=1 Tax=Penaeus monodon TaxID=6687 RepID=UPI0018A79FAA|nr:uncharacterized protein LOC119584865 [Penaeus monodon]